ncbi:KH domain-containing protein [Candidatus Peregrinibacteria bacterium]|nr:KH domain-containing protein [Candidatus Peregrinibacteria bacterium]
MSEYIEQGFLEYVLKNLLDDPTKLVITRTVDDLGVLLEVQVSESDMGKLIGKGGQTAKALRILLRLIGAKKNERINLKILEPPKSEEVI